MSTTDTTEPAATRWVLDAAHSSAEFRVPNFWGLVKVKGHFERLDGWLEIDQNGDRRIELMIDAASLNTGNRKRDEHLRSADFFNADNHPDVHFRAAAVTDAGEGRLHVEGELLAAGHTATLELEPSLQQTDDQLQIEASATLDQRLLGMTWSPLGMARTPTTLIVQAQLQREG